jgi:YVTN family beta-propeller protein
LDFNDELQSRIFTLFLRNILLFIAACGLPLAQTTEKHPRPGIKNVQVPFSSLHPSATFILNGHPDWMTITPSAVWVANDQLKVVHRIDPQTNREVASISFTAEPCSGLVAGFGSLWVPLCGKPASLARIDLRTNQITATLPIGPADSEGGITASTDSIWIVTDKNGTLTRIDPATNTVRQKISIAPGSYNPLFSHGTIWISGTDAGVLTAVDAATGKILTSIPVGPKPRFLTSGAGSIWTLNQGDGTVSRVDKKSRRVTATITVGIPGAGGEICFGQGSIWTTVFDIPLTRIDTKTSKVLRQWVGTGGDSVRFGHGSLWLTDYKGGVLWRIPAGSALTRPAPAKR